MQIKVLDPVGQTIIFALFFLTVLILSIKKSTKAFFPLTATKELKGFAMLAIIFSHIGYFLSAQTQFLYPFSILAGVGVNLFLFLSGFGLTISALKNPLSIINFYKKRLLKLFIPLWMVIILLILTDLFFLGIKYPIQTMVQSFLGFFPSARIYESLDSPLWYFTMIFFYYLIFPLTFFKKYKYLSVLLIFAVSFFILQLKLPLDEGVLNLFKLHFIAFPLGVLFAVSTYKIVNINYKQLLPLLPLLIVLFIYSSFNSGVGQGKFIEQTISLLTMFSLILLFMIKNFQFRLFSLFGIFSYEIYLIHWPILYRYGLLYKLFPPSFATIFYLIIFLGLGFIIQKIILYAIKPFKRSFNHI